MQAVNNILESAMSNSNKPIRFVHLQRLAKQSMLNVALVIEKAKTSTVAFMKAGLLFGCSIQ